MKCQVDKIKSCWGGKLIKWKFVENGKLMKWQAGVMTRWQKDIAHIEVTTSCWNGKLMKWQDDENTYYL